MGQPVRPVKVAPSLLAADFSRLGEEVKEVERGGADLLHLDVMDGVFVPNLSFGPVVCQAVRRVSALPLDVHLMVTRPEVLIEPFAKAGADRLSVHVEVVTHLHRVLVHIREAGMVPGVALNPLTPLASLDEVWPFVGFILLMTVNPGFGGQSLIPETVDKLARLSQIRERVAPHVELVVDGGVTRDNALVLRQAGADVLVAGTAVFAAADRQRAISLLKGGS